MLIIVRNLIYLGILIFAAGLVIWGLLGNNGAFGLLRGKIPIGVVVMAVGGAVFLGAAVIWAAYDFTGERILITAVGKMIEAFLNEPFGGQ